MDRYKGQCFCYPTKKHGECTHCNRARMWIDQDVLVLANELGEMMLRDESALDDIENLNEQEVCQWYIVTDWLHGKLRDAGEVVAEWAGQCWWGRMCCGQGIELDSTFQQISRRQHKLKFEITPEMVTALNACAEEGDQVEEWPEYITAWLDDDLNLSGLRTIDWSNEIEEFRSLVALWNHYEINSTVAMETLAKFRNTDKNLDKFLSANGF